MISMDVEISKFFIYVTYILLQLSKNFCNSTITVPVFGIKDFFGFLNSPQQKNTVESTRSELRQKPQSPEPKIVTDFSGHCMKF